MRLFGKIILAALVGSGVGVTAVFALYWLGYMVVAVQAHNFLLIG